MTIGYVSRMGLDPEVAIVNKNTGLGRSAHMFLGDDKRQFKFYTDRDTEKANGRLGSEIERDGAALEVRSLIASACRDNIIPYMAEALRGAQLELEEWDNDFQLSVTPKFELDDESLVNAPEDVLEFGCNPDYDAYALELKSPELEEGDRYRYTGGHIHVSPLTGLRNDMQQQAALAILFDYFVSLPMTAILGERHMQGEADRRLYYGQPGSFRFDNEISKMEFRTLSGKLMLHPTILYWAMGMTKSFIQGVNSSGMDAVSFLKEKIASVVTPETIHNAVMSHDYELATELVPILFPLLPNYRENESVLANPVGGGGGGTSNPYFFQKAFEVYDTGNREGIGWDDDLRENWGLYSDYEPKHHAYWGIQTAMVGLCDNDIFPYNEVLPKVWPAKLIQKSHIYTHPKNGGDKQYTTPAAAGWLA